MYVYLYIIYMYIYLFICVWDVLCLITYIHSHIIINFSLIRILMNEITRVRVRVDEGWEYIY